MKRIAFAAATAALLGTGCISSTTTNPPPPPPQEVGSVNLYWSFQKTAPAQAAGHIDYDISLAGTPNGACAQSAVETVTVDSPLGQHTVTCVASSGFQGIGLDGIPAGLQAFRFRGYRGSSVVYDTTVSLQVFAGTTAGTATEYDVVVPGTYAPVDLSAYLRYGSGAGLPYATCADAYYPYIGYSIRDVHGNLVDDGGNLTWQCTDPLPTPVPRIDLDLDNYDVRMQGYASAGGALVFDSCAVPLDHFAAQTGGNGFAPVLYTAPVPTCP